jgi:hypothetical protein
MKEKITQKYLGNCSGKDKYNIIFEEYVEADDSPLHCAVWKIGDLCIRAKGYRNWCQGRGGSSV